MARLQAHKQIEIREGTTVHEGAVAVVDIDFPSTLKGIAAAIQALDAAAAEVHDTLVALQMVKERGLF